MPQRYWDIVAKNMKNGKNGKTGKNDKITVIVLNPPQSPPGVSGRQPGNGGGVYTGAGPDGRIQPDRPAMVDFSDGRGRVLHEDEQARPGNGGVNVTPSPLSRMYVPRTEAEQMNIKQREQTGEFEGYQTGGNYQYSQANPPYRNPRPDIPDVKPVNITQPVIPQTQGINITQPQNVVNPDITQPVIPQTTPIDITQPRPGIPGPTATTQPAGQVPGTRPPIGTPGPGPKPPIPGPEAITPSAKPIDVTAKPPVTGPDVDVTIPDDIPPDLHNYFLEQYQELLRSYMDRQQAANLAAQKARAQRSAASPYLTTGAREAMAAEQERYGGLAASNLAAQLAEKGIGMAFQAESLNLQKQQFEFAKQKYGDEWGQRLAADINAGMTLDMLRKKYPGIEITQEDYDSMKQMAPSNWQQEAWLKQFDLTKEQWEKEFGFSVEQFQTNVSQWEKQFGFGKEQWQKQFDFAKEQYGDLQGQRIVMDINNGMSYDMIKQKYPDVTLEDYNHIKENGPLAQIDYNKKMDALQILLQGGDFAGAGDMLNKMFPGLDADFSQLINEQNQDNFNNAMNSFSKLIASGLNWDEALTALKADGTFDRLKEMGLKEDEMKQMYDKFKLSTNPIYQLTHTLDDEYLKKLWPNLTPEQARTLIANLAITGGITMDDDGNYTFDQDLINTLLENMGIDPTGGPGPGPDPDYTYQDYVADVKESGGVPLTEDEWTSGGKNKYEWSYDEYVKACENNNETPLSKEEWEEEDSPKYEPRTEQEQWDDFMTTVASSYTGEWEGQEGFIKWKQAGKPRTFQDWKKANPINELTQPYYDRFLDEGWGINNETNSLYKPTIEQARKDFLSNPRDVQTFSTMDEFWAMPAGGLNKGDIVIFPDVDSPMVIQINTHGRYYLSRLDNGDMMGLYYNHNNKQYMFNKE